MKLSQLVQLLGGQLQGDDVTFETLSIDSRAIKSDELFVAIKGDQFDGHEFIAMAKERGAVAAIVNKFVAVDLPQLIVADTRLALGKIAALHRQQFNIPVIGLTGSCGKTTTKEMLRSILAECGSVLASVSSFNNNIGVPLTLLQLNKNHQFAVIEMGANSPGEIAYLTDLVKPTLAFILNVAPAHIEGFGSIDGVMRAKSEIFAGLAANGTAMINIDDKYAAQWQAMLAGKNIVTFGVQNSADYHATDISCDNEGYCQFNLHTPLDSMAIKLPLLGEHYALNAVAAAAAAHCMGASLTAIKTGLENVKPVKGRLVLKSGLQGTRIFDDTYNANPYAVAASLKVLANYADEKVFVFGGMHEIGDGGIEEHRQIGKLAKTLGVDRLFACGEFCDVTVKAFGEGAYYFSDQNKLTESLLPILQPGMIVLVKGSRGAKMENVVAKLVG